MLYNLLYPIAHTFPIFNLLKYITFRGGMAVLTSLLLMFIIMPKLIKFLKGVQRNGQPIREDGPISHLVTKKGTPTMGGIGIIFSTIVATLLWVDLRNKYVWIIIMVAIFFTLVGFFDDYKKLLKRSSNGTSGRMRLFLEILCAVVAGIIIDKLSHNSLRSFLSIPFLRHIFLDLGLFYIPFCAIVIVGSSNAVNLTDGLDGLAIVPVIIVAASFALISYIVGNIKYSEYLFLNYIKDSGEITIFCAALIGAGIGFLWFNCQPAEIFMGDTGSLPLGASIGAISIIIKHEIVLAVIGGLFVIEAISVILQVASFKTTGRRIFKMAPIHHHFEKAGWPESKVVIRFWILTIIFAIIGLSSLKIR